MNNLSENKLALTITFLFAAIITASIIYQNSSHLILGHSARDVFFYLIQALRFSGTSIGGYEYVNYLSPFIPFLTSLLFRAGFISQTSIFITSGVFFIFGILAMFYILKLRFNNYYSVFGAFLYGTLYINITWVGNGTLDIAFISILIWALYFFIKAIEESQKFFYIAFPLAVLSFFTKYPGALVIPLMGLYFLAKGNIKGNIKKYYKNIIGGFIVGIITAVPFLAYFTLNNIPLGFINQANEISSTSSLSATHNGQLIGNDIFFYIKGLIYDISSTNYIIGIIILAVTLIGFVFLVLRFKNTIRNYTPLYISIIIIIISFLTAGLFSFIYSEALLFLGLILFAWSYKKVNPKYNAPLSITMFGLYLGYLVFFTSHLTKADRYFTSMAPGFIFITILSIESLMNRKIKLMKYLIPIMIILMIFSSANHIINIDDDSLAVSEDNVAKWFEGKSGIISSDRAPVYTWYLQKEVIYIQDTSKSTLLNENLLNNDTTYYVTIDKVNLDNYSQIKQMDKSTIYKVNN